MKTSELLAKVKMLPVHKARNLDQVGWADGYMVVKFRGRDVLWVYGPAISESERDKILRVPFPDSIFNKCIKAHYQAFKIASTT